LRLNPLIVTLHTKMLITYRWSARPSFRFFFCRDDLSIVDVYIRLSLYNTICASRECFVYKDRRRKQ